jgi:hypothetical protein
MVLGWSDGQMVGRSRSCSQRRCARKEEAEGIEQRNRPRETIPKQRRSQRLELVLVGRAISVMVYTISMDPVKTSFWASTRIFLARGEAIEEH